MSKTKHPMNVLLECGYVTKDKQNEAVGYTYASDEAVSKNIRDKMRELGLHVKSFEIVSFESSCVLVGNTRMNSAVIHVRFLFSDGEKDYGPYEAVGSGMDKGDKHFFKALTGARKYAIAQSVLLSWGDDPEGDATVDKLANEPPPPVKILSDAAKKVLGTGDKVASEGLDALKQVWKMTSPEIQKELSGHPEWEKVKAKAEVAKKAAKD